MPVGTAKRLLKPTRMEQVSPAWKLLDRDLRRNFAIDVVLPAAYWFAFPERMSTLPPKEGMDQVTVVQRKKFERRDDKALPNNIGRGTGASEVSTEAQNITGVKHFMKEILVATTTRLQKEQDQPSLVSRYLRSLEERLLKASPNHD